MRTSATSRPRPMPSGPTIPTRTTSARRSSTRLDTNRGSAQAGTSATASAISGRVMAIAKNTMNWDDGDEAAGAAAARTAAASLSARTSVGFRLGAGIPNGLTRCLATGFSGRRTDLGGWAGADAAGARFGRAGGGGGGGCGGAGGGGGATGCGCSGGCGCRAGGAGTVGGGTARCALVVGGGSGFGIVVASAAARDPLTKMCVVAKPRTASTQAANQRNLASSRPVDRFGKTTPNNRSTN